MNASPEAIIAKLKTTFPKPIRGHFFSTSRHPYFYDANTGGIMELDEIATKILPALGTEKLEDAVSGSIRKHGLEKTAEKAAEIVSYAVGRQPPIFSTTGPEEIRYYLSREQFREKLLNGLGHLVLSVTDECNQDCRYCVYSGKYPCRSHHLKRYMSREVIDRSVDYLHGHSSETDKGKVPHLGFYGGEPLLAFERIRYAVKRLQDRAGGRQYSFGMTTNLTALRPEMIPFLVEKDFALHVSLDGPKEVHDRYRVFPDGTGTFETLMGNLRKIRDCDPGYFERRVSFSCVLAPPYRLRETEEFFRGFELKTEPEYSIRISRVDSPMTAFGEREEGFYDTAELSRFRQEYLQRMADGRMARTTRENVFYRNFFEQQYLPIYRRKRLKERLSPSGFPGGICVPGQRKLYVRVDGNFYPCERVGEYESLRIGNCFKGADADGAYRMCEDFARATESECKTCWCMLLCGSMCFRDSHSEKGCDPEMKRSACAELRNGRHRRLVELCSVLEVNEKGFDHLEKYVIS